MIAVSDTDHSMDDETQSHIFEPFYTNNYPHIRLLYMSRYPCDLIFHQDILDHETNFLQKPFTLQALIRQVKKALITETN
jgi:hypothetical protein